jgi:hypothetical protein
MPAIGALVRAGKPIQTVAVINMANKRKPVATVNENINNATSSESKSKVCER